MISARARATGQVFGRVDCGDGSLPASARPDIDAVSRDLAELWRALGEPLPVPRNAVGRAFARLGARLAGLPAVAQVSDADAVLRDILRRFPVFALPAIAAPQVSILLRASTDFVVTYEAIAALAPVLRECEAEIVLVDDGADPATALISAVIGNLVYVFGSSAPMDGARGRFLLWIDAAAAPFSAAALCDVLDYLTGGCVLIGRRIVRAAHAHGVASRLAMPPRPAMPRFPFDVAMERHRFEALGGFDLATDDGKGLGHLDLVLRAAQAGVEIVPIMQPDPGSGAAMSLRPIDPERDASCAMAFHRRWGSSGAKWQAVLR